MKLETLVDIVCTRKASVFKRCFLSDGCSYTHLKIAKKEFLRAFDNTELDAEIDAYTITDNSRITIILK